MIEQHSVRQAHRPGDIRTVRRTVENPRGAQSQYGASHRAHNSAANEREQRMVYRCGLRIRECSERSERNDRGSKPTGPISKLPVTGSYFSCRPQLSVLVETRDSTASSAARMAAEVSAIEPCRIEWRSPIVAIAAALSADRQIDLIACPIR